MPSSRLGVTSLNQNVSATSENLMYDFLNFIELKVTPLTVLYLPLLLYRNRSNRIATKT